MIHAEKLNAILHIFIGEKSKEIPTPNLSVKLICEKVLKINEKWEIDFLTNILFDDEYLVKNIYNLNTEITHKGIKFVQSGAYKNEFETRELESKIKVETLKNLKRSKIAIYISAISLLISIIIGALNYTKSTENKSKLEIELMKQNIRNDSILNVVKNKIHDSKKK